MSPDKLAYMANQIGRFFQSQKNARAAELIEDHLRKFWDPRMRQEIVTQLAEGRITLDPPVREAVERLGQKQPA
ncbi:MAG: formate dehydrogenase subunit delta [Rhodopila sp.]|jgi:formate dehydrogenase subunit delta